MAKKSSTPQGPKPLRGIRNPDLYPSAQGLGAAERQGIEDDYARAIRKYYGVRHGHNSGYEALKDPAVYRPETLRTGTNLDTYGQSKYDQNGMLINATPELVQDLRAENQSNWDVVGNGLIKAGGKTLSTVVNTAGFLYGIGDAIYTGFKEGSFDKGVSKLWNNDITNAMADFDQAMEEAYTNYRTTAEQNAAWYDPTSWSMAGFADNFISNAGFMLGAAIGAGSVSGLIGKGMTSAKWLSKIANSAAGKWIGRVGGAILPAGAESSIEAVNASRDYKGTESLKVENEFAEKEKQLRDDFKQRHAGEIQAIEDRYQKTKGRGFTRASDGSMVDPAYAEKEKAMDALHRQLDAELKELNKQKAASLAEIEDRSEAVGNLTFGLNMPILTISDMIVFGNGMQKSFDAARKASKITEKAAGANLIQNAPKTSIKQIAKDAFSARRAGKNVAKVAPKETTSRFLDNGFTNMFGSAISNGIWEEGMQGAASDAAKNWQTFTDVDNYWRSRLDPDNVTEAVSLVSELGKSISKQYTTAEGWQEMVVGAISGFVGMPMPNGSLKNWTWHTGVHEYMDYKNRKRNAALNAQAWNEALSNDELYDLMSDADVINNVSRIAAGQKAGGEAQAAAARGDKKTYLDKKSEQLAHYINIATRAGAIEDMKTIAKMANTNLSDSQIDEMIDMQAQKKTAEQQYNEVTAQAQERITDLDNKATTAQAAIDRVDARVASITNSIEETKGLSRKAKKEAKKRNDKREVDLKELEKIRAQHLGELETIAHQREEAQRDLDGITPDQFIDKYDDPNGWVDSGGNRTKSYDEIRKELEKRGDDTVKAIERYQAAYKRVSDSSLGLFNNDQEDHLTHLAFMSAEGMDRLDKIFENIQSKLPNKITLTAKDEESKKAIMANPLWEKRVTEDPANSLKLTIDATSMKPNEYRAAFIAALTSDQSTDRDELLNKVEDARNGQLMQALLDMQTPDLSWYEQLVDAIGVMKDVAKYENLFMSYMKNPDLSNAAQGTAAAQAAKKRNSNSAANSSVVDIQAKVRSGEYDNAAALASGELSGEALANAEAAQQLMDREDALLAQAEKAQGLTAEDSENVEYLIKGAVRASSSIDDVEPEMAKLASALENIKVPKAEEDAILNNPNLTDEEKQAALLDLKVEYVDKARTIITQAEEEADKAAQAAEELESSEIEKAMAEQARAEAAELPETARNGSEPLPAMGTPPITSTPTDVAESTQEVPTVTPEASDIESAAEEQGRANPEKDPEEPLPRISDTVKGYWKSNTTEAAITPSQVGDSAPYHERDTSPQKKLHEAIHKFLKDSKAFDMVKAGMVKPGRPIRIAVSKKLHQETNVVVPLLVVQDASGKWVVVGDMISSGDSHTSAFKSMPAYEEFLGKVESSYESKKGEGEDDLVLTDTPELTVRKMLVGRPMYSAPSERNTLNDIWEGNGEFKLGVATGNAAKPIMVDSRKVTADRSETEARTKKPLSATPGCPYVLVKTAAGYFPVPFSMPKYSSTDPEVANSDLGRLGRAALEKLIGAGTMNNDVLESLKRELCSIFNFSHLYLKKLDNGNVEITYRIAGQKGGDPKILAPEEVEGYVRNTLLPALDGNLGFQVDASRMNTGDYNRMIGQIARTNLAIGGVHTINDFPVFDWVGTNGEIVRAEVPRNRGENPNSRRATPAATRPTGPTVPPISAAVGPTTGSKVRVEVKVLGDGTVIYYNKTDNQFEYGTGEVAKLSDKDASRLYCKAYGLTTTTMTPYSNGKYYNPTTNEFVNTANPSPKEAPKEAPKETPTETPPNTEAPSNNQPSAEPTPSSSNTNAAATSTFDREGTISKISSLSVLAEYDHVEEVLNKLNDEQLQILSSKRIIGARAGKLQNFIAAHTKSDEATTRKAFDAIFGGNKLVLENPAQARREYVEQEMQKFLDNFGITIRDADKFGRQELFNALDRAIFARSAEDITDGVGEAVAFMMQYHPQVREVLESMETLGLMKALKKIPLRSKKFNAKTVGELVSKGLAPIRKRDAKALGKEIAKGLRQHYGLEQGKPNRTIWQIIKDFLSMMNPYNAIRNLWLRSTTNDIVQRITENDKSLIVDGYVRPGETETAGLMDVDQAIRENPYEADIIYKLGNQGIYLGGSASIAVAGSLYRRAENPMHDIDFNAAGKSPQEIENAVKSLSPYYVLTNHMGTLEDKITYTYMILDRPFKDGNWVNSGKYDENGKPVKYRQILDANTGEVLGMRRGSDLILNKGVKGKMLDFFTGKNAYQFGVFPRVVDGKTYQFAHHNGAMSFKVEVAREKDIWDYNRFIPNNFEVLKPHQAKPTLPQAGEVVPIQSVRAYVVQATNGKLSSAMVDRTLKVAEDLGIHISFGHDLGENVAGLQVGSHIKIANWVMTPENIKNGNAAHAIIHELIHGVTEYVIDAYEDGRLQDEHLVKAVKQLQACYEIAKSSDLLRDEYALTNLKEMIAELSNVGFRKKAKKVGIWGSIKNAVKSIFGRESLDSQMEQAYDTILEHFDKKLFNEYTQEGEGNLSADIQAIQKEMDDIKQKAIKDGTFMKAPNGAKTNLSERQWLQVRTKAFKDWFGDWERVAKNNLGTASGNTDISKILNKDGSINFEALEKISDEFFKNADESLFKKGRKTLRTRKEHHVGEGNTLEHLQNVAKSAQESNIREDLKPQLLLAAALHDLAKPFHGGQKHGFQSVEIINSIFKGNISNLAKFAIRHHMMTVDEGVSFTQEDADRIIQDAVDNNLNVQDAIEMLLALNIADITSGRDLSTIDQYAKKPLRDVINAEIPIRREMLERAATKIKSSNASKVVDENGEPLVVYHGTTAEFDSFDKSKLGVNTNAPSAKLAFFASSSEALGRHYAGMQTVDELYTEMKEVLGEGATLEDAGIGPEDYDEDYELYSEYEVALYELLDSHSELMQYASLADSLETTKTQSKSFSKGLEWVEETDLNTLLKEGWKLVKGTEEDYNNGKTVELERGYLNTPSANVIPANIFETLDSHYSKLPKDAKELIDSIRREKAQLVKKQEHLREQAAIERQRRYNKRVKAVFLNIRDTKIDDDHNQGYRSERYSQRIKNALANGNDGGVIKNTKDPLPADIYYFFGPNQIKSATDNIGTFSRESNNINYLIMSTPSIENTDYSSEESVTKLLRRIRNGKEDNTAGVATSIRSAMAVENSKEEWDASVRADTCQKYNNNFARRAIEKITGRKATDPEIVRFPRVFKICQEKGNKDNWIIRMPTIKEIAELSKKITSYVNDLNSSEFHSDFAEKNYSDPEVTKERLQWSRLDPELQMGLMDMGIDSVVYNRLLKRQPRILDQLKECAI